MWREVGRRPGKIVAEPFSRLVTCIEAMYDFVALGDAFSQRLEFDDVPSGLESNRLDPFEDCVRSLGDSDPRSFNSTFFGTSRRWKTTGTPDGSKWIP